MDDIRTKNLRETKRRIDDGLEALKEIRDTGRATDEQAAVAKDGLDATKHYYEAEESDALMHKIAHLGDPQVAAGNTAAGVFSERQKEQIVAAAKSKSAFATEIRHPSAAKADTTLMSGDLLPSAGNTVALDRAGGIVSLRDLLTAAATQSPTIRYYRVGTGTAETVAEGAQKPDLGIATEAHTKDLQKVAGLFTVTDELADDASFLVAQVQQQALRAIANKENALIVAELDSGAGHTKTGDTSSPIDTLAEVIGERQDDQGVTPDAIVMNPKNLAAIRKLKADSAGTRVIDPLSDQPSSLYGVRLVPTGAVDEDTMFAFSRQAGYFYTRNDQIRIEMGTTGDDFAFNRMTYRVEERVAPVVVLPDLVTKVSLSATSG
jgi:hypothetical protein